MAIKNDDLLSFRRSQLNEKHSILTLVFPAHGDGGHAVRVLVQVVAGELEIRPSQGRLLDSNESKGLGKNGNPAWTLHAAPPCFDDFPESHLTLNRDAGYLSGKMQKIADESALGRQRQRLALLEFVHDVPPAS